MVAVHDRLLKLFPQLPSSVFYEFATVGELATHLVETYGDVAARWLESAQGDGQSDAVTAVQQDHRTDAAPGELRQRSSGSGDQAIAIIGLSGRYAKARTLDEYWENLKSGRDCMSEIPAERWSLDESYVPEPAKAIAQGKSYCKWLGYLEGFADFDPLFFGIAPKDAMVMDPQERLFVQACWEAIRAVAPEKNSPEIGALSYNVAVYWYQRAQYEQAEPLFQHLLQAYEQALGATAYNHGIRSERSKVRGNW